jgi:uridine kinase
MEQRPKPYVIGIAGGSGSGKTALALRLSAKHQDLGVSTLSQDNYYFDLRHLSMEQRSRVNFDHPSSLDHDLFLANVRTLVSARPVDVPQYDFRTHTRSGAFRPLLPSPILLLDGLYVLWDARLRELIDLKVFLDADSDLRLIRRLCRDVGERGRTMDSVIDQYLNSVRPMYRDSVEPTRQWADIVLVNHGTFDELVAAMDPFMHKRIE